MPEKNDWQSWLLIGAVGALAYLINMIARGEAMTPRAILVRNLAKSLIGGVVTVGIYAVLSEFRTLNTGIAIAIAGGVALFGVDTLVDLLRQYGEQKTGLDIGGDERARADADTDRDDS